MSRSYKYTPVATEQSKSKRFHKNLANRKIRKLPVYQDLNDGSDYRRQYDSYMICDFRIYRDKLQDMNDENCWWKYFRRK